MSGKRRTFSADFKARVARDAMREAGTLKAVAVRHGVHASQSRSGGGSFRREAAAPSATAPPSATRTKPPPSRISTPKSASSRWKGIFLDRWANEPR